MEVEKPDYLVSIAFTRFSSPENTTASCLRRNLRFLDFFVRMWFLNACLRLIFPEAVFLKRFAAPEFDFIFGMNAKNCGLD